MKATLLRCSILSISMLLALPCVVRAAPWDPAAADYSGHKGKTLYVSKQGDNSDGRSWQKAFRTIQAALLESTPQTEAIHLVVEHLLMDELKRELARGKGS